MTHAWAMGGCVRIMLLGSAMDGGKYLLTILISHTESLKSIGYAQQAKATQGVLGSLYESYRGFTSYRY